jgi:hypothetical protein
MGVSTGDEGLVFLLGNNALKAADPHPRTYFAVQRRRPDGQRWLEVGRFATKQIAQLTLEALVAHGHGEERDFRVKKVTLPEGRA